MVNVPAPFKNGIQSFIEKIEEKSNKTKCSITSYCMINSILIRRTVRVNVPGLNNA